VVSGVVALIAIIAFVLLCLRSRRRRRDAQAQSADDNNNLGNNPHGPEMARKSIASVAVSQGTTLHSPHPQSPSWSPQGSPPPPFAQPWHGVTPATDPYYGASPPSQHQLSGDWGQSGKYQQTYYPPPLDPSQSHMHVQSVEMPSVKSPANVPEMPETKSPIPFGAHRGAT
jgi:hypothetical protein